MADMKKINPEELEGVAGGANEGGACKTVTGLKDGYLAIRNVPVADYNNEVNHTGLKNGDKVLITGGTVLLERPSAAERLRTSGSTHRSTVSPVM